MNGWVKMFRSKLDWEWFTDVPTAHLWEYITLRANPQNETWRGIEIPRGSFVTSEEKMAMETGLSRQQVRTAIKKLVSTNEITKRTTNNYTIITVVKFNDYQSMEDYLNQPNNLPITSEITSDATSHSTTGATTNKEDKKIRRKEDKKNNILAPSFDEANAVAKLPLNVKDTYYYISQEDVSHYQELYPAVDVMQELRSMVGWCEANPTKRKTKTGAPRFINTWLSKSQNRGGRTETKKGGFTFFDIDGDLPSLE